MAWWGKQSAQTPRSRWNLDDYHTAFAAHSKAQIEQGVSPWQKPLTPGAGRLPENIQTGTPYRGSNSVYLSVTQTAQGYRDHRWATYKQIHDMGGQVRTGEQATHVLFYKFDDQQEKAGAPATPATSPAGAAEQEQTRPPMVRVYAVFNVEQADHLTLDRRDDQDKEPEWKAHQTAERVIRESGIHVAHVRGDRAFYNMETDKVTLPEREQMATANGYYQIAMHELGHATGHPLRMDRDTLKNGAGNFGCVEYAREELRVEMSAMLTGDCVGVGHDGSRGAAYVKGWITALDQDPREICKAAGDAQKISDYLMRPIRAREQETAQQHRALAEKYSAARSPQISSAPTARPLDPRPPLPVGADGGPRADDRQPEGDPQPRRARRSRAGDKMTSSSAQVETSPESPATVPTLQDRAGQLAPLGWTGREAEWLALVALHSGVVYALAMSRALPGRRRPQAPFAVRPRPHREGARHRGRAAHLPRRRARRPADGQAHLSGAWHPRRAPPPGQGRDDAGTHAPAPLARLHHRAADLRLAPDRGRQGTAVRGARG